MDLYEYYLNIKPEIDARLASFNIIPEFGTAPLPREKLISELMFCLCTPQTSPLKAEKALEKINLLAQLGDYKNISKETIALSLRNAGVRFHNVKADNIYNFLQKEIDSFIVSIVDFKARLYSIAAVSTYSQQDIFSVSNNYPFAHRIYRNKLYSQIKGLGFKEASHFMRNIGLGRYTCILDRHIMRRLADYKVIPKDTKLTKKNYEIIEGRMIHFAGMVKIPVDALDFVFWHQSKGFIYK